ncbi:DUF1343 domain-containing protein [Vicingus serpentipes]|uniref:DUF1343 domain-containing protein n=2 Tax=Vicingus serpentipes TaxID=1926625 RepID=A0A5C6S196_9FLAO|nr:DUF1343 domain-containing protein [Vicingus serpentipes]
MQLKEIGFIIIISLFSISCVGQDDSKTTTNQNNTIKVKEAPIIKDIIVAANLTDQYIPLLKDKKVGIVGNHTSLINQTHLVDSLLNLGIDVVKVFSPEHGFRGNADAGEKVNSNIDEKTKLPIVSLYGKNKKPSTEQLKGLNVVVFDIQDVGTRFYTYISTMSYVMEACAENNIKVIVLDRPNPNGHYIDGPILNPKFSSFIGMHQVPIVHGMTIGEYAQMANGEHWLANSVSCDLTVIKMENYDHNSTYTLPLKPSPNLPNMKSIYLYPFLCLFEGTPYSIGRGTEKPFQIIGHPNMDSVNFSFIPKSMEGAKNPKLKNEKCFGVDLSLIEEHELRNQKSIELKWLIEAYKNANDKDNFFSSSFNLLAGSDELQTQLKNGLTEKEIKASWQDGLAQFKETRKKYLLYKDFE